MSEDQGGTAVAEPKYRTQTDAKNKPKQQPPYAVVILNDNDHTFMYVTDAIMKVFKYDEQKAIKLTTQVHKEGRAVVWTGSLEVAELKREQVRGMGADKWAVAKVDYPLGVDLEPLEG
jgi:ATP-dependent Clp protease adaptor protein ClpS